MKPPLLSLILRLLAFGLLWLLIGGRGDDWLLVVAIVCAATASSFALWPVYAWKWRFRPLPRFIPYFLKESVAGGFDVARRAFTPGLSVRPGMTTYLLKLRCEAARVFFAWMVSLLPGTASVRLDGATLNIHVLDTTREATEKLRQLENHIAALFGEEMEDRSTTEYTEGTEEDFGE